MLDIFRQEQALRPYYDFINVDGVRYTVDGVKRMFVSAVRELPSRAFSGPKEWLRYWGSAALMYTHGFGLVMAPANQVDAEGRPIYAVSTFPPSRTTRIRGAEPRIYYGEGRRTTTSSPTSGICRNSITRTRRSAKPASSRADVRAGIPVDGVLKRVVLALQTRDLTAFLFSSFIDHGRTRVHLYRTPMRRVSRLAPFLFVESNNLAFVADTRIEWLVNALTTTDMYPYAFREDARRQGRRARDRGLSLTRDQLRRGLRQDHDERVQWPGPLLPGTTTPSSAPGPSLSPSCSAADAMPQSVREQLNYPLQWFHIQFDDIYKRYHMRQPIEFYNVQDLWDDADEVLGSLGRGLEEFGTQDEMTFSYEGYHALLDPADLPAGAVPGGLVTCSTRW